MLIDKYKPENLENIVGNSVSIKYIQTWFENWHTEKENKIKTKMKTTTKPDTKNVCALLSGPNGIGKTLTVELLIKKYDLNPIILNPDEKANKDYIMKTIIPSIKRQKSFTNKQNIFVIHDIDCYDDYGFISSVVACLKETKIPVIATCNDRYDQSLKPLISYCLDVKFQKPNTTEVVKFVKPIIKKEDITMSDVKLNQIIEDANYDIRNILNNLQLLIGGNTKITSGLTGSTGLINSKDKTNTNVFEVTKQFMSQNVELDDKQILFWMNNDLLPLMIHENYPANSIKMKNEVSYLNNIADSSQCLSDIDLFEKNIHMNGNWELMPYTAWNSIKSVANCHAKAMIKFTSFFEKKESKKQTLNYHHGNGSSKIEKTVKKKQSPKSKPEAKPKAAKAAKAAKAPKIPKEPPKTKEKITNDQSDEKTNEKPKTVKKKKVKLIIEE
jgi:replication factor C subunit 1